MRTRFLAVSAILTAASALPSIAQQRAVTAADYARAERFMSYETTRLVSGTAIRPTWLPDDRFWFRDSTPTGTEIILLDAAKGTRTRCDNERFFSHRAGDAGRQLGVIVADP